MIKAGDKVKVIEWGKQYTICSDWFKNHKDDLKYEWVIKYRYNNNMYTKMKHKKDDNIYDVLYVDERCALISTPDIIIGNIIRKDPLFCYSVAPYGTYLIDITGLEKIEPKIKDCYLPIKCKLKEDDIVKVKIIRNSDGKECIFDLDMSKYDSQLIDLSEDNWCCTF